MTNSLTPKALTLACALAMSAIASAQAADVQKDETKAKEEVHALAPVTVDEKMDRNGVTTIRAVEMDMLPSATGTINDVFRGQSSVQFDSTSRAGGQGAEILPPRISIRGSHNYENSFLINGMTNNNMLNPGGFDASINDIVRRNASNMPQGDAQSIMLDTDLLETLTLMSENVSAEYGNFTGGVINAKIRDAQSDRWHVKAWMRHTRDSWAKIHLTPKQESALEHPIDQDKLQPEFKKTTAGVTLDGPLFDGKLGAVISYQKTHASAPIFQKLTRTSLEEKKSTRDKETFLLRLNTDKEADFYANTTLIYSPYESNYFVEQSKDAERDVNGGGWNWSLNTVAKVSIGNWSNDLSFLKNEVSRLSNRNISYQWDSNQYWGTKYAGDLGSHETEQNSINFKSVLELNQFNVGPAEHKVKFGVEALYTKVTHDKERSIAYSKPHSNVSVSGDLNNGIVSGKEWFGSRVVSDPLHRKADYLTFSAFIEDSIRIERLTLKPGVRIDNDDITQNVNIAPRISFDIDILNDTRFNINGGYNRYYGNQILSQAVAGIQSYTIEKRDDWNGEWKLDESKNPNPVIAKYEQLGDLETPYSDEYVLGASAKIWDNTIFRIQGVLRDHKDLLKTKNNKLTNDGETHYKGITFSVEKGFDLGRYGRHYSEFGITYSKLDTNNMNTWASYGWDPLQGAQKVWLDGVLTDIEDLPATNFNSDIVATYSQRSYFIDDRLRTNLLVRYETPGDRINRLGNGPQGLPNLVTFENDKIFNVDLNTEFDLIKTKNSTLTLNMEILNLFDHEGSFESSNSIVGSSSANMGRQFWLGMSYTY